MPEYLQFLKLLSDKDLLAIQYRLTYTSVVVWITLII